MRVGISVVLLIFLFKHVDKKSLFEVIRNADSGVLLFAFFVFFFNYLFCLLRWQMLLKAFDINLALKRVIISFCGGIFFNLFLPSTIGGDLMRSLDLAAHTHKPKEVLATVLLDRLSGFVGLVIVTLTALAFGWKLIQDKAVVVAVAIISAILIAILLVLFNSFFYNQINRLFSSPRAGRIREAIKNLHHELHIFRQKKKVIILNLIYSLLIQAVLPVTFYITALSLGLNKNIIYYFVLIPVIGAITLLPISIGGLGLRDATMIYFFAKIGVSKDLAFAMSLLNFAFVIIYGALGGLVYVLTVHHRRIQHLESSAVPPKQ